MAKKSKAAKADTPVKAEAVITPEEANPVTIAGVDHLMTEKAELPLVDKPEVIEVKEELPIAVAPSPYDQDDDIESIVASAPVADKGGQWVNHPSLVKKVTGYKDTLAGTLYFGKLK